MCSFSKNVKSVNKAGIPLPNFVCVVNDPLTIILTKELFMSSTSLLWNDKPILK